MDYLRLKPTIKKHTEIVRKIQKEKAKLRTLRYHKKQLEMQMQKDAFKLFIHNLIPNLNLDVDDEICGLGFEGAQLYYVNIKYKDIILTIKNDNKMYIGQKDLSVLSHQAQNDILKQSKPKGIRITKLFFDPQYGLAKVCEDALGDFKKDVPGYVATHFYMKYE